MLVHVSGGGDKDDRAKNEPPKEKGPRLAGQKILKERLPFLLDGFSHLVEIERAVINVRYRCDDALRLQGAELMV